MRYSGQSTGIVSWGSMVIAIPTEAIMRWRYLPMLLLLALGFDQRAAAAQIFAICPSGPLAAEESSTES
jgi:hypothetical protein